MNEEDATPRRTLLDLRDELDLVGQRLLAYSPRDALRFCQACLTLHDKLAELRLRAEAGRLCWLRDLTTKHELSEDGRTLTAVRGNDSIEAWAAGRLLPAEGTSSWKIRVVTSKRNDGNGMWVGVCDAAARCSWGLFLYSGRLRRVCVDANGKLDFDAPLLDNYPNGNFRQVMKPPGEGSSLRSRANGAEIEVIVDHDEGTLGYRINGGQYLEALPAPRTPRGGSTSSLELQDGAHPGPCEVFPRGMELRPYASAYYHGDSMRFTTAYVERWNDF